MHKDTEPYVLFTADEWLQVEVLVNALGDDLKLARHGQTQLADLFRTARTRAATLQPVDPATLDAADPAPGGAATPLLPFPTARIHPPERR